jgi:ABC-type Fe3+/spermidine/putrescine transport system ATPase subunit
MNTLECIRLTFNTNAWTGDYSVKFSAGEWNILCGPSGSGKSTFLNLICGLLTAKSGDVYLGSERISNWAPHLRKISYMNQVNSLFPEISILENLLLSMHRDHIETSKKKLIIETLTSELNLDTGLLERMPSQLSIGQLSRFNLARALLFPCEWLLLDEPFAAVDRTSRLKILSVIKRWQLKSGAGILLVSHDLDDIFTAATHVSVFQGGKIIEKAPLTDAIDRPTQRLTAELLRSGLIVKKNGMTSFVPCSKLFCHAPEELTASQQVEKVVLEAPQVTKIGSIMRIIDLNSTVDVTLPWNPDFNGTLWFQHQDKISLGDHA